MGNVRVVLGPNWNVVEPESMSKAVFEEFHILLKNYGILKNTKVCWGSIHSKDGKYNELGLCDSPDYASISPHEDRDHNSVRIRVYPVDMDFKQKIARYQNLIIQDLSLLFPGVKITITSKGKAIKDLSIKVLEEFKNIILRHKFTRKIVIKGNQILRQSMFTNDIELARVNPSIDINNNCVTIFVKKRHFKNINNRDSILAELQNIFPNTEIDIEYE